MVGQSRHAAPLLVGPSGDVQRLQRIQLGQVGDEGRREAFVQELIHGHPDLIPTAEIEPAFAPLIPVCLELATPAGYVDNFFLTPWGGLALAECKLFRNPQARREVVAQALDYARAIQGWHYDDLEKAVRQALKQPAAALYNFVRDSTDLDEAQFADAVERNLKVGRILLLIVAEGIQEGVEALTEFLQLHAGLHVGVALVELSLWRGGDGQMLVVPRVPMKTVIIERGIVTVARGVEANVSPSKPTTPGPRSSEPARRVSLSEEAYFDRLDQKRPGLKDRLLAFVGGLAELGVTLETGKTALLRWRPTPQTEASAGMVDDNGQVWFSSAYATIQRRVSHAAAEAYVVALAMALNGQVRRYEKSAPEVLDKNGRGYQLGVLIDNGDAWKAVIASLIQNAHESAE